MSDVKDYQVKEIGGFAWNGDSIYYSRQRGDPARPQRKSAAFFWGNRF
jgi:hypothetical protein